jgi:hypothetical protein
LAKGYETQYLCFGDFSNEGRHGERIKLENIASGHIWATMDYHFDMKRMFREAKRWKIQTHLMLMPCLINFYDIVLENNPK